MLNKMNINSINMNTFTFNTDAVISEKNTDKPKPNIIINPIRASASVFTSVCLINNLKLSRTFDGSNLAIVLYILV